jgi:hypothetical protein
MAQNPESVQRWQTQGKPVHFEMKESSLQNRRSYFRILRSESEKRPFKSELQSVVLKRRCVDRILEGAKTTKESIQAQGIECMLD